MRHAHQVLAAVERKTLEDFTKSMLDGMLNYALAELAAAFHKIKPLRAPVPARRTAHR